MAKLRPMHTAPKDAPVLLFYPSGAIQGAWDEDVDWDPDTGPIGGWRVIRIDQHGCGCCSSNDEQPSGWLALPERG
jgi:hypothetical protein